MSDPAWVGHWSARKAEISKALIGAALAPEEPSTPSTGSRRYPTASGAIYYDATRCRHFAECVRSLPAVFDPSRRPWIDADAATESEIADVVRRCPSGALQYDFANVPPEAADGDLTTVLVVQGGPVLIRGEFRLIELEDGRPITRAGTETRAALCGCARSGNSPLCDGACEA